MDKLIELLNEYDKPVDEDERVYSEYSGNFLRGEREDMERMSPEKLCEKKFGFIKWLVDNDKIYNERIDEVVEDCGTDEIGAYYCKCYGTYESLLMLLAIQDEPIEFLISILK